MKPTDDVDESVLAKAIEEVSSLSPEEARAELSKLAAAIARTETAQEARYLRRRALFVYLVDAVGDTQASVARLGRVTPMVVSFARGRSTPSSRRKAE